MDNRLLSTLAAARLLGVGPTSVKRWADAGLLHCVRTPGGHRRFDRAAVETLLQENKVQPSSRAENTNQSASVWMTRLLGDGQPAVLDTLVKEMHTEAGSWWRVAESLSGVLEELGERWQSGSLSVVQEHVASERFARLLARTAESVSVPRGAPVALLLTAEGEEHTLGLSLIELCVRESGYATRWAGRKTPISLATEYLAKGGVDLVAVSASVHAGNHAALEAQAIELAEACKANGAELLLGGRGAWPDVLPHGYRVRSYQHLTNTLASLRAAAS